MQVGHHSSRSQRAAVPRRGLVAALAAVLTAGLLGAAPASAQVREPVSACPAGEVPSAGFADLTGDTAAIDCLLWWGLTTGTTPDTYGPSQPVTRAQLAAVLARLLVRIGAELPAPGPPAFSDSALAGQHAALIEGLAAAGVLGGYPDGTFRPGQPVRRDQVAAMLVRTVERLTPAPLPAVATPFLDLAASEHRSAIEQAYGAGLVAGRPGGGFDPAGLLTRRQLASFVVRAVDVAMQGRVAVRIETTGLPKGAAPSGFTVVEDGAPRRVPVGGTVAIDAAGARVFAPPVLADGTDLLPARSPFEVAGSAPLRRLTLPYAPPSGDLAVPDRTDAAAVAAFHDRWFVRPTAVGVGWTGSLTGCAAGSTSPELRASELAAVNAARALAGLSPVREDPTASVAAQQTALLMAAQAQLSHTPGRDWACWSQTGADTAGRSNLHLGNHGAAAIEDYFLDPGDNNRAVGHRRWLLDPTLTTVGLGDVPAGRGTPAANAVQVVGPRTLPWGGIPVTWPTEGYFPAPLVGLGGRWSLSLPGLDAAAARVTATIDGTPTQVQVVDRSEGYGGAAAVVFTVPDAGLYDAVSVQVSAPGKDGGAAFSHAWTTTLVPAAR